MENHLVQSDLHSPTAAPLKKYMNVRENRSDVRVASNQNRSNRRCNKKRRKCVRKCSIVCVVCGHIMCAKHAVLLYSNCVSNKVCCTTLLCNEEVIWDNNGHHSKKEYLNSII